MPIARPTVSIVIPALNEARNLERLLPTLPPVHEVVLVDGGSVDGTVATARRILPDIRTIQQTRTGKGNALACGFAAATGEVIVMLDADGSADPDEIPAFVQVLVGGADVAKGSRRTGFGGSDDLTFIRAIGNDLLTALTNLLFSSRYTDLCYGYNAFWRSLVPDLRLVDHRSAAADGRSAPWGDGFEIETVLNIRFHLAGHRVVEVPSVERPRVFGRSNLRVVRDGVRVLRTILVEWQRSWKPIATSRSHALLGGRGALEAEAVHRTA